jgi:hypothetical protein
LELAANAHLGDLILRSFVQIAVAFERDQAGSGADFARNHIQKRRFPGPVRANHHTQFPRIHAEIQIIQRSKSAKGDGEIFGGQYFVADCLIG